MPNDINKSKCIIKGSKRGKKKDIKNLFKNKCNINYIIHNINKIDSNTTIFGSHYLRMKTKSIQCMMWYYDAASYYFEQTNHYVTEV